MREARGVVPRDDGIREGERDEERAGERRDDKGEGEGDSGAGDSGGAGVVDCAGARAWGIGRDATSLADFGFRVKISGERT